MNYVAAIHAEKARVGLSDQDYRLLIVESFGRMSSKALSIDEQKRLLELIKAKQKRFSQSDFIATLLTKLGLRDEYATSIARKIAGDELSHWKFAAPQTKANIITRLKALQKNRGLMSQIPLDLPVSECQPSVDPKHAMLATSVACRLQDAIDAVLRPFVAPLHHTDIVQLLEQIGGWQPVEVWQETYALMFDVVLHLLRKKDLHEPEVLARDIVLVIADYLGSGNVYFPAIDPVRNFIRDSMIYTLSGRVSAAELGARFGISETWVYDIVRQQSTLRRPRQGKLFAKEVSS